MSARSPSPPSTPESDRNGSKYLYNRAFLLSIAQQQSHGPAQGVYPCDAFLPEPMASMDKRSNNRDESPAPHPRRILTLFGTRPEVIKLAPVVHAMEARPHRFLPINVASGQHTDLIQPFAKALNLHVHVDLQVGSEDQTILELCQRLLATLGPLLSHEQPDAILVQGDTTTAFAGALAGFYQRIPVGHVEAGLRSGDPTSPFPEEMNRRLITQLASFHFAATEHNQDALLKEGVPAGRIVVTGNPVVDSVRWACDHTEPSPRLRALLRQVSADKLILLTTHRRESFGSVMIERLRVLRRFVDRHVDVSLVFPVHPNPGVRDPARSELSDSPRIHLIEPLGYLDFIHLMSKAWLIVSDSGGVQEEAPSLGKPLLVIRENTERPEAIAAGIARLVGRSARKLEALLEECYSDSSWIGQVKQMENPFGSGDSGQRISDALDELLAAQTAQHGSTSAERVR